MQNLKKDKASILINLSSGSADTMGDEIKARLMDNGYRSVSLYQGPSDDMDTMLSAVRADRPDLLVTYGGDGTSNAGAKIAIDQACIFLPLPGGTMNMLHKDIFGTDDWRACLDMALASSHCRALPFGRIGPHIFLVEAILGSVVKFQGAREALRDGDAAEAVKKAIDAVSGLNQGQDLHYQCDDNGPNGQARLIRLRSSEMHNDADKPDQLQGLAVDMLGFSDILDIGWNSLSGHWQDSEPLNIFFGHKITISGGPTLLGMVDGERLDFDHSAVITQDRTALRILAPQAD